MDNIFPHRYFTMWQRSLLAIFVTALLIRSAFILTLQNGFYFPDSLEYSQAATNLLTYGTFGEAYHRSPMYPLVLAVIYALFGQHIVAIRLVQAVMGACIAVMIAFIAQRPGSKGVGILAGVLWSVYPLGVFMAGLEYPTSVTALLLAGAVLCMLTEPEQALGAGRVLLSGLLFGAAALTIPVALVAVVATTLWILYWQPTRRLVLAMLFLLGVALSLTPWTLRNFYVYGQIVIVEPRLIQLLPRVGPVQQERMDNELERKIKAILRHPDAYVRRFIREFGHFWELYPARIYMNHVAYREAFHERDTRVVKQTLFGTTWTSLISILSVGPAFLFALIGIWAMGLQKEQRRTLSLLCMTILSFAIGYSFFWGKTRYRLPVEPYIILLSAYGLRQTWAILAGQTIRGRLGRMDTTAPASVYLQPTDPSDGSGSGAIKASFSEP
jgi:4-amino-4-deoxy-L-arabinose transferase-like glycosyltransferase